MLVHLREHHPDKYSEAHPKVAKKGIKAEGDGLVQPILQQTYEHATKYPPQLPTAVELNSVINDIMIIKYNQILLSPIPTFKLLKLNYCIMWVSLVWFSALQLITNESNASTES